MYHQEIINPPYSMHTSILLLLLPSSSPSPLSMAPLLLLLAAPLPSLLLSAVNEVSSLPSSPLLLFINQYLVTSLYPPSAYTLFHSPPSSFLPPPSTLPRHPAFHYSFLILPYSSFSPSFPPVRSACSPAPPSCLPPWPGAVRESPAISPSLVSWQSPSPAPSLPLYWTPPASFPWLQEHCWPGGSCS